MGEVGGTTVCSPLILAVKRQTVAGYSQALEKRGRTNEVEIRENVGNTKSRRNDLRVGENVWNGMKGIFFKILGVICTLLHRVGRVNRNRTARGKV